MYISLLHLACALSLFMYGIIFQLFSLVCLHFELPAVCSSISEKHKLKWWLTDLTADEPAATRPFVAAFVGGI